MVEIKMTRKTSLFIPVFFHSDKEKVQKDTIMYYVSNAF